MLKKILLVTLFITVLFSCKIVSRADDPSSLQQQIDQLSKQIADLEASMAPLQKESTGLQSKITLAKSQINKFEIQITDLGQKLIDRESDLEVQKTLLSQRVRQYYINTKKFNPLMIFLASAESSSLLRQYTFYQSVITQDRTSIVAYVNDINTLNVNKTQLEAEKVKLAAVKKDMETRFGFLAGEIKKAETYKAELSQKQQQLIAQKLASLNLPTSLGAGPLSCADDRKIDPGFGTGFAFFTFGIPHHVGMNQYGAYGRAKAGQNYHDILNAYFNNVSFDKRPNITIKVQGYGSMPIEIYLLGIYEVPGDWPLEALKAQAVAARTYALNYTNMGANTICTTQACQVYKGGNKGGGWEQAVKATEGEVLTQNGQPITAWFASTAGGYTYTSSDVGWASTGWTREVRDTSGDVNSFDDLFSKAYDKDSPCFYAAQGFRPQYNKSAWLKPEELADIVNVILLAQKDTSTQNHLYPPDRTNGEGTDTWDAGRVKTELSNRGVTPYNTISSATITDWDKSHGKTNTVSFSGDAGSVSFDGTTFKNFFNLRAPGNLAIVGPLFNVEKR